ncbi:hypothetical protein GCM10010129_51930 [Streptomyces fumigatiscleroticus]|nr:hypothetical protein GCM10010129_51930 [Streptomyces fumigatiscleroticus]
MKRPGPLLTLLVGVLLGLSMLAFNTATGTRSAPSSSAAEPERPPSAEAPAASSPAAPPRAPAPDGAYTGRTDDDSAAVAVTVRDRRAVAYYCDGRARESWLRGEVRDDGGMRLTGKDGAELNGTLRQGRRIRGTVDAGGGHQAFTADRAEKPSGPYRATADVRDTTIDGGWVVLKDGGQVGILTRDGTPGPAPRIDPETGVAAVDGRRITARPVTP